MKTTTYPEQYLLITNNGSGENTIIELGVNALLDIETLVTEYFDELGVSASIETFRPLICRVMRQRSQVVPASISTSSAR